MSTDVGPERVAGCFAGRPLIVVVIQRATMTRVRELTLAGHAPTWFEHDAGSGIERVATTDPEWFAHLERSVRGG